MDSQDYVKVRCIGMSSTRIDINARLPLACDCPQSTYLLVPRPRSLVTRISDRRVHLPLQTKADADAESVLPIESSPDFSSGHVGTSNLP